MPENVSAVPRKDLTPVDVSIMVVGIVLGIGICKTPSLVARYAGDETVIVSLWLLGGLITVIGSVRYAELGSARPDAGGKYAFLREAYGSKVALLFAWARCTVIQPGAIAAAAFVMGDYANVVRPLGAPGPWSSASWSSSRCPSPSISPTSTCWGSTASVTARPWAPP
ncbi:amino acid permease [Streptomyces vinaceus]|uniref:amino acid permease n=1 Tax=Streptomyces vinaceus TaxID=1960 RepID=UPI003679FBFA